MKSTLLLTAAWLVCASSSALAQECCDHCGCGCNLRKVCRLVCIEKEVKETVYCCECEDFCVPGPSCKCGKECHHDCTAPHGCRCKEVWQPTCADVRTRNKLIKKEVVKKVPSWKWVVETVCCDCASRCGETAQEAAPPPDASVEAPLEPLPMEIQEATMPKPPAPAMKTSSAKRLIPRALIDPLR